MDYTGKGLALPRTADRAPFTSEHSAGLRSAGIETGRTRSRVALLVIAVAVALLAFALRAVNLAHAFDVYYDEVVYSQISEGFAQTFKIEFASSTAYVHPPLMFVLEGAYLRLFSHTGSPVQLVLDARYFNVVMAGLSASMLFLIARRVAGWWAGIAAAAIFALDPFLITIGSRDLLQPSALLWVLAGYAALFTEQRSSLSGWRVCAVGLAFSAALLTDEQTAFHTLLPLAILFVLGWSIARRQAVLIGLVPCLLYGMFAVIMAAAGQWTVFWQAKTDGVRRLFGALRISGYGYSSRAGGTAATAGGGANGGVSQSPSFTHALMTNLDQYATTYVVLGLGAVAVVYLLLQTDGAARALAVWTLCAYALQAYSVKFGTNEEQYYYYVVAPALVADVTAAAQVLRSRSLPEAWHRWATVAASVALVLFLGWAGYRWVDRHTTLDNGFQRLLAYMQEHVPQGSRIAATNLPANALLLNQGYQDDYLGTLQQVEQRRDQFAIVSSTLISEGYDVGTPALYNWLGSHGTLLFAFKDPTYGALALYRLPAP